jgi:hypothetical protein
MSRFRLHPSPRITRLGAGIAIAVLVPGSGLFASAASAAPTPTRVAVTQYETIFDSYGQHCVPTDRTLYLTFTQSGQQSVTFPTVFCGNALFVQAVSVDASCPAYGRCTVSRSQVVTVIAEPGAWAYWIHDVPRPSSAYVRIEFAGERLSNFVHVSG